MNKNKFIKTFEGFTKDKLQNLINNKKTYAIKKVRIFKLKSLTEFKLDLDKIKYYDFSKFKYTEDGYGGIDIFPDIEFLNIYKKLCEMAYEPDQIYNPNLYFHFTLSNLIIKKEMRYNLIDFENGVPEILRGASVAYKLYLMIIDKNNFITSGVDSLVDAYNLWYNLLQDEYLYAITSNTISVLIKKNLSDVKLKEILDKFKGKYLEFDDDLEIKIKQLYGSLDIYTQGK